MRNFFGYAILSEKTAIFVIPKNQLWMTNFFSA